MKLYKKSRRCRICGSGLFTRILSLGAMPPANAFVKKNDLNKKEYTFPLDVYFCRSCSLLQLRDIVSSELLFRNYLYVSSTSPVFIAHFDAFAQDVCRRFRLPANSLVVDIGSNDGILLKPFKRLGMRVLGIDPATTIARQATKEGIETVSVFFTPAVARTLQKKYGSALVITATNVFAHVNDLRAFLKGVVHFLDQNGVFMIEVPYLVDFLQNNFFDTVYHEHLSYFALKPLVTLFAQFGMRIINVQKVAVHGGSMRVTVAFDAASFRTAPAVRRFLAREKVLRIDTVAVYKTFAKSVEANKRDFGNLLRELKKQRKTIAGYGAPAKATTLFHYFHIDNTMIDYIVDDSAWKQNLYTPGTHIPVKAPDYLYKKTPDYVLILAWNYAKEIMEKLSWFKKQGGKFIIPVPRPQVR